MNKITSSNYQLAYQKAPTPTTDQCHCIVCTYLNDFHYYRNLFSDGRNGLTEECITPASAKRSPLIVLFRGGSNARLRKSNKKIIKKEKKPAATPVMPLWPGSGRSCCCWTRAVLPEEPHATKSTPPEEARAHPCYHEPSSDPLRHV